MGYRTLKQRLWCAWPLLVLIDGRIRIGALFGAGNGAIGSIWSWKWSQQLIWSWKWSQRLYFVPRRAISSISIVGPKRSFNRRIFANRRP